MTTVSLGLDFGTESVRAVLIGLRGQELATVTARYRHGQIIDRLPTGRTPLRMQLLRKIGVT